MAYTPQTWVDNPGGGTPLNATRLNHMETGIDGANDNADSALSAANTASSNASSAQTTANTANSTAGTALTTANAAVPKSLIEAKGDLVVGSASGVAGRLPVLADERFLEADSAETLGLKWGRKITVSDTAPPGPRAGDIWLQPVA